MVQTVHRDLHKHTVDDVRELRRAGGRWLKELRESAGLSQRELAQKLGLEYLTAISQMEIGRGRITPDRYMDWASALGVPPGEFVKCILKFYDPITFSILFRSEVVDVWKPTEKKLG
jgi:transcriptional regulator with XRE-family HTH domain